jgi:hypothetical protein
MNVKPWQCKNNHVLGIIQLNGNRVPQLMLYRHAVDASSDQPAEVDLMIGPVLGRMPVRCDICDDVKPWDVSVDALAELIRGLRREQFEQLQLRLAKKKTCPHCKGSGLEPPPRGDQWYCVMCKGTGKSG